MSSKWIQRYPGRWQVDLRKSICTVVRPGDTNKTARICRFYYLESSEQLDPCCIREINMLCLIFLRTNYDLYAIHMTHIYLVRTHQVRMTLSVV